MSGILVYAEAREGQLSAITAEMLSAARPLANQMGAPLSVAIVGDAATASPDELAALGADRVYRAADAALTPYRAETHVAALKQIASEAGADVILLGQTVTGRDLGPQLAFGLEAGIVTDCIELQLDGDKVLFTKPVYGGKAVAIFECETAPQVATIRPKTFEVAPADAARKAEVVDVDVTLDPAAAKTAVIERVHQEDTGEQKIEDAVVVVSGGRGMGAPENFSYLEELAKVLGGAVGGSLAAVDAGWVPSSRQVGLSGKVVKPNLYVAVGISGAMQHLAGCSGAKTIVAINRDGDAPIFKAAHYGVVGDWKQVIPAFTSKCQELLEG